jgi:hypothetical protein
MLLSPSAEDLSARDIFIAKTTCEEKGLDNRPTALIDQALLRSISKAE